MDKEGRIHLGRWGKKFKEWTISVHSETGAIVVQPKQESLDFDTYDKRGKLSPYHIRALTEILAHLREQDATEKNPG